MAIYIYELLCPITGAVRYIGKSIHPERRFKRHIADSRSQDCYKSRWIRKLAEQGKVPTLRIAVVLGDSENWQHAERQAIQIGWDLGFHLTNTSVGGEGVLIADPEVEARRIAAVRVAWQSKELRDKHAEISRKVQLRPEMIAASRSRMRERWSNPNYVQEQSRLLKEYYQKPGARSAQAQRMTAAHADKDRAAVRYASIKKARSSDEAVSKWRESMGPVFAPQEYKDKQAAALRTRHQTDAGYSAKVREALADPAVVERRNASIKTAWAARMEEINADPERRALETKARQALGMKSQDALKSNSLAAWADPVKRAARIEKCRATRAAKKLAQAQQA